MKPSISTVSTMYWLNSTSNLANATDTRVTGIVYATSTATKYMTYNSNHGGSGAYYWLVAAAGASEYEPYNVRGTWSPN